MIASGVVVKCNIGAKNTLKNLYQFLLLWERFKEVLISKFEVEGEHFFRESMISS